MSGSIEAEKSENNPNFGSITNINSNSNSIIYISKEDSFEDIYNNDSNKKNEKIFMCRECKSMFLLIFFKNDFTLNCKCDQDYSNQNINIEEKMNNICYVNELTEEIFYSIHATYTGYCSECKIHLNDKNKDKHENHSILYFQKINIDDDIETISLLDDSKNNNIKFKEMNKKGYLKEIINLIINGHKSGIINYNLFQSIKNIVEYFKLKAYSTAELEVYIESVKSNKKNKNILKI